MDGGGGGDSGCGSHGGDCGASVALMSGSDVMPVIWRNPYTQDEQDLIAALVGDYDRVRIKPLNPSRQDYIAFGIFVGFAVTIWSIWAVYL